MPRREGFENLEILKEEYEKIRKQYKLPSFDELDREFELRKIDCDANLIKEIRRNILHKIDNIIGLLEPILDPKHTLHSFVETKIFEKHNVEAMFAFYKKLWYLIHKGIQVSYVSEKAEVDFIKEMWEVWPELKKQAAEYAKQIADGWAKAEKETFTDKYLQ
ncbi:MAG: hypothetical protein QW063_01545 [Candidatus Nanoarchaeia archaeon]